MVVQVFSTNWKRRLIFSINRVKPSVNIFITTKLLVYHTSTFLFFHGFWTCNSAWAKFSFHSFIDDFSYYVLSQIIRKVEPSVWIHFLKFMKRYCVKLSTFLWDELEKVEELENALMSSNLTLRFRKFARRRIYSFLKSKDGMTSLVGVVVVLGTRICAWIRFILLVALLEAVEMKIFTYSYIETCMRPQCLL